MLDRPEARKHVNDVWLKIRAMMENIGLKIREMKHIYAIE